MTKDARDRRIDYIELPAIDLGDLKKFHGAAFGWTFVRAQGGRIVKEIFDFHGGRRFQFADPSGNELAVRSDR